MGLVHFCESTNRTNSEVFFIRHLYNGVRKGDVEMNIESIKQNKLHFILSFSVPSIAAINLGLPVLYLYLGIGLCVGAGVPEYGFVVLHLIKKQTGKYC